MSTPLERAEQAVAEAWEDAFFNPNRDALDALVAAVEIRCDARNAPAEACPLHSPTGDPCGCGHDGGADCHPGARRTT